MERSRLFRDPARIRTLIRAPRYSRQTLLERLSVCPQGLWDQQSGTVRTDNDNKVRARDADTGGVTTTLQRNPVQSRLNPFADNISKTVRQQFAPRTLNLGGVRRRHSISPYSAEAQTFRRHTTVRARDAEFGGSETTTLH